MTPPIKELIEKATPGPWRDNEDGIEVLCVQEGCRHDVGGVGFFFSESANRPAEAAANAQLIARCNPATMLAVVEALIDAHLYIDDGLEGSPAKRKAMLLQLESALNLLNGKAP